MSTHIMNTHSQQSGFTLIELMVVTAIIAILAAIAYPSYTEFVRRSARSEAKAALLENAQFMERNFTMSNKYSHDSASNEITSTSLPVQQTPRDGTAKYTITVAPEASTFTLTATPTGASAGDPCGSFTLNNLGEKGLGGTPSRTVAECWNK